jgi:hypothetical protein
MSEGHTVFISSIFTRLLSLEVTKEGFSNFTDVGPILHFTAPAYSQDFLDDNSCIFFRSRIIGLGIFVHFFWNICGRTACMLATVI